MTDEQFRIGVVAAFRTINALPISFEAKVAAKAAIIEGWKVETGRKVDK